MAQIIQVPEKTQISVVAGATLNLHLELRTAAGALVDTTGSAVEIEGDVDFDVDILDHAVVLSLTEAQTVELLGDGTSANHPYAVFYEDSDGARACILRGTLTVVEGTP